MSRANARKQADAVYQHFIDNFWRSFTPEEVHAQVFDRAVPLTSVRRAFTELADAGKLDKTRATRPGLYGVNVRVWRLAVPTAQMELV